MGTPRFFFPDLIPLKILYRFSLVVLLSILLLGINSSVHAEEFPTIEHATSQPLEQFWVNPGFYSFHFQTDKGLNNSNPGIGVEYRYSTASALTLGQFYNSARETSHYAGLYWEPLTLGKVRMGAVVGGFDGYPNMLNGGWFLALIPIVSIEYDRIGANIAFVPTYQDRLYGAISVQLKFKLY